MDKTERTIAKVTNAGRILSRIAWIFDLIACGCSAFLILAALLWWNTRPDLFTGYASQTGALLICAGDLIGCAGSAVRLPRWCCGSRCPRRSPRSLCRSGWQG